LTETERDASITSTYGTGQLIRHALDQGCRHLIIGLGGSATNDGGAGLVQALGAKLLDEWGNELPVGGLALANLAHIDLSGFDPRMTETTVQVASDVTNPLCGPEGATYIFGPQKGIVSEAVKKALDQALQHFSAVILHELHQDVQNLPGAGAAGGLGAGLLAFCNASLVSGIQLVMETVKLSSLMQDQQLVITGEGRTDVQTQYGKVPQGVARLAQAHGVPVFAVCGSLGDGYEALRESGVTAFFSITPGPMKLQDAMAQARQNLVRLGVEIGHLLNWKESR
ncbi:MAG: glycerate kinase, partial [Bacilli bacterium]|nr:glycerate kinase [Bacilli bacterium]